jgi:pilus assembly protein CpaE
MEQALKVAEARSSDAPAALRILLFAEPAARGEICTSLARMKEFHLDIRESEFGGRAAADGVDAVMVMMDHRQEFPIAAREARTSDGERPLRVALLGDRTPQKVREALAAGADEVLFMPLDQGEIARALFKLASSRRARETASGGKIWAVSSVTAGVGVTTVAANCALALAYWGKKKVALVDLDYESGDLAAALNLEPDSTIMDLNEPVGRLNSPRVEAILCKHPSGVYFLAGPKRLEDSDQISGAHVSAVLEHMQQMVDYVVVDTGRHINDTAVAVWERSGELLYVIDQSVRAMRGAWRFLDLFLRLKIADLHPKFVLNRFASRRTLTVEHITNTLGRPLFARVPQEERSMELAQGRGEDLWKIAHRSRLTASFEALARELCGDQEPPRTAAGLFGGLLSRNGTAPVK